MLVGVYLWRPGLREACRGSSDTAMTRKSVVGAKTEPNLLNIQPPQFHITITVNKS